MNHEPTPQPLQGKELLNKLKTIPSLSRSEKARQCGYYTVTKDNKTRVNLKEFMGAILLAKGVELDPLERLDGRGKKPTYKVSVHQNGQIVIGATYTQTMRLEPGDEFDIKLGYKHIHLNQLTEEDEDGGGN